MKTKLKSFDSEVNRSEQVWVACASSCDGRTSKEFNLRMNIVADSILNPAVLLWSALLYRPSRKRPR